MPIRQCFQLPQEGGLTAGFGVKFLRINEMNFEKIKCFQSSCRFDVVVVNDR